jgi:hypothetical protein
MAFAQYKEGYIITNTNDSISGLIKYEGAIKNSASCTFKNTVDDYETIYKPYDIVGFRFKDSKYFISDQILIDNKPTPVFLEWLIKGEANILCYSPKDLNIRYFIRVENDSLIELKNTSIAKTIDNREYQINKKEFIATLKNYLKDEPKLFSQIESIQSLDDKRLIELSKDYHSLKCSNEECIVFEDKNRKFLLHIAPTASYINTKAFLNSKNKESIGLTSDFGYGINLKFTNSPTLAPKFSYNIGFIFHNFEYLYNSEIKYVNDYRIASTKYIHIPCQVQYKILNQNNSFFISGGPTINFRYNFEFYDDLLINTLTEHYSYNLGFKPIQLGINAGLGYEYHFSDKFYLNISYSTEYLFRFWGTYVSDKSFELVGVANASIYYHFNSNIK